MFKYLIFGLGLLTLTANGQQKPLPFTQRIYSTLTLTNVITEYIYWKRTNPEAIHITGSFWITSVKGEKVIVTAAHNLGIGSRKIVTLTKNSETIGVHAEPLLGLLAYEAKEYGIIGETDWVLIRPKDTRVCELSKVMNLANEVPGSGAKVRVYGYPGTPYEQLDDKASITQVLGKMVVLNKPFDAGYSGGVVLDEKDKAIGLIVSTDLKQSHVLILTSELLEKVQWHPLP